MRDFVAKRAKTLPYSGIREIFDLAGKLEDVIHFEIGEPDFDTPEPIVQGAFRGAMAGMTHYTGSAGLQELREKIAGKLSDETGVLFNADNVVVTAGGMEALLLTMFVTLDEKDEVIFPSPHWPNYPAHVLLAGGKYKKLPLAAAHAFKPSIEALERIVTNDTKMLLINYPHNPTGAVLEREDLEAIAKFAVARDLLVCTDEAYETIIFDGRKFLSIAALDGMQERTIIIRTFSKTYAMTGWRIGYIVAPEDIAKRAAKLHEHTSACTSSISQMGALAALEMADTVSRSMVEKYESRRDIVIDALKDVRGLSVFEPRGTFYAFVDISSFGMSSFDLSRRLLEQARVAVAPGSAFGKEGEGFIRICFANSAENIKRGLDRMNRVFREMG